MPILTTCTTTTTLGTLNLHPFQTNISLPEADLHQTLRLGLAEFVPFARTEDDYIPEDSM